MFRLLDPYYSTSLYLKFNLSFSKKQGKMIIRSVAVSFFVFSAIDAWVIRPHQMAMHSVKLAAVNDPDYLMPADVFKQPSWEPTTAQPFILQPLQSSAPPTPPEDTTAASSLPSDQDDMFLISAATSVSRPPAPTTHPSALRPSAPQRPSVPATSVDDRNILFWRDRMTAQEEERNQKGFRPAFSTEQLSSSFFHANISEENTPESPETSFESVASDQATFQEHAGDVVTTGALSDEPVSVPAAAVPTSNPISKQPVVGNIQVQFWRDRMNEQEEARNRQGFRMPFTENTETQVTADEKEDLPINGANGSLQEEESSTLHYDETEATTEITFMEASEENPLNVNGRQGLLPTTIAINGEVGESTALETEQLDMASEPALTETTEDNLALGPEQDAAQEEAQLDGENLTYMGSEAISSVTDEGDTFAVTVTDDSLLEPALLESENDEVSAESLASSPMTETDQVEEFAELHATESSFSEPSVVENAISESGMMELTGVNGVHDMASFDYEAKAISTGADQTNGLTHSEDEAISEHLHLDSGVHINGDHNVGELYGQIDSTSGVAHTSLISETDHANEIKISSETKNSFSVSDVPTMEAKAPINANSSTKELLQYLFTGSPDGSDQLTDETVSQYLADPSSVLAKLNGGEGTSFINGDDHNGEGTIDAVARPANGKSEVVTPSTDKLLDILFGVTEAEPIENAAEDAESTRNGTSEPLDASEPLDTSETQNGALSEIETLESGEKTEKEKLTSTKVRAMALFTLKELLLQDRQ